jgi:two-component system chemotaxis response regulator CheY
MPIDRNLPILIVDDYRSMLRIIRNLLRQIGFLDIDEATDGTMALAMLRQRPYRLIISDWNMQPMSGLSLLKTVRGDPVLRTIPFIMVTAESKTENVLAARDAGVNNYIVKPFSADTLKAKIAGVLEGASA